jgi:methyl-accepting chemotaxis protein
MVRNKHLLDYLVIIAGNIYKTLSVQQLILKRLRSIEEKMSALSDAVAAVREDVSRVQEGVKGVLDKLNQPNPDVEAAVSALTEIDAAFDQIAESLEAANGTPTAPEPTPEG